MSDLIDRHAAIDILDAFEVKIENGEEFAYPWARMRMSELPSAQPEVIACGEGELNAQPERKTGKWIRLDEYEDDYWECSECKDQFVLEVGTTPKDARMFYCPVCGAKMEVEHE